MLARYYFQPSSPSPSQSPVSVPGPTGTALPTQGSFNIALQDGAEAGQTVPHVHVHVIPRIRGSTAKTTETPSDRIYEQMADEEGNVGGALWDRVHQASSEDGNGGGVRMPMMKERPVPGGGFPSIEDAARKARSMAEMEEEAALYRQVLKAMEEEEKEEEEEAQAAAKQG